ncbi:PqiC family protein [Hydrocarboniphaga sp.]|uniref:PqiC family protein n=1 Tax=Hydrocarboniphaga sp. TaxID=2033016 RepID=UPI003D0961D6
MKHAVKALAASSLLAALAACSSAAPVRYYTLVKPLDAGAAPQRLSGVDVLPVKVPAAADYPQLVLRQGAQRVELIETRQWIAPLPQEIRNGLVARLSSVAAPAGADDLKLSVDVTRFESVLDSYALLEAQWELRAGRNPPLECATRVSEQVGEGFDALVAGHQAALDRLADAIAIAVRSSRCP